ncbi:MAG: APC family permease [Armatimonadetes bacterium]|nr:APC family permease [Armatimonadota bacterium]
MSTYSRLKKVLIGKPIATKHAHHERLPKVFGLPVFASDALSSVAYATEEVLLVLVMMGAVGFYHLVSISVWLCILLVIVGFSYYQTIHAYPQGGGTYMVSTENLGSKAGRIAGSALLIDYILTVAVSISSAVSFVVSAFPDTKPYSVWIACAAIALLAIANLRGAKESGILFAIPTYTFVVSILVLVAVGLFKSVGAPPIPPDPAEFPQPIQAVGWFLMLRAFAASCTALTGTEAIADGVQAFRPPEAKNASATLAMMVGLLLAMFIGISWCAQHFGITPMHIEEAGYKTVVAQLAERVFPSWPSYFYLVTSVTALILFLAANTAFADFPRLSSFIARDGYLPRQLMSLGDRLVFQNGIVTLAGAAMLLVIIFRAETHALIPLYALGVFISFTLSQAGMVARWFKRTQGAWANYRMWVSLVGAITTGVVAVILAITKFAEGAWLIFVAMAIMLTFFYRIRKHYEYLAGELGLTETDSVPKIQGTVLLLVPRLHKGVLQAIGYAKSMAKDVRAVHVILDSKTIEGVRRDWNRFGSDIPLVILESPYRSLIDPLIEYIDETIAEEPNAIVTVIVPQAVPKRWYQGLLHNNVAVPLKMALSARKNVVITNVRYFLN